MRSFSLARGLAALGHQVTLLASRSSAGFSMRRSTADGVTIIEMPDVLPEKIRHGGLSPLDTLARILWVSRTGYDVIHAFDHRPAAFVPAWLGRALKGGLLVSDWADLWGREGIAGESGNALRRMLGLADGFFERAVRKRVDGVTAITSDLDRRLAELGVPLDRRMILPPGAGVDLIEQLDPQVARRKLGLPLEAHIAAFSGYAPYDQAFMNEVILKLLDQDHEAIVISCGAVNADVQSQAMEAGTASRLIQFGTLPSDEISLVLGAADCLMLPYLDTSVNRGRFPNKFGDYLAAGRAIITHPTGDLGALVEREKVAILSSQVPDEFVQDLLLLLHSREKRARLGILARDFAAERWTWTMRAQEVSRFYQELLARR